MQDVNDIQKETTQSMCIRQLRTGVPPSAYNDDLTGDSMVQMTWLTAGRGIFMSASASMLDIGPGQLVIDRQRRSHIVRLGYDAEGYSIRFSEIFLFEDRQDYFPVDQARLHYMCLAEDGIPLSDFLMREMTATAQVMQREQSVDFPFQAIMLREYLKILLVQATRNFAADIQPVIRTNNQEIARQFINLVETNFKTRKQVSEYADLLAVTANYLNSIVKKITGYSASHYIRQRVIIEAKRQLQLSGARMKEVAYNLGFDDPSHFSKYFKSSTGTNFSTFKKKQYVTPTHAVRTIDFYPAVAKISLSSIIVPL